MTVFLQRKFRLPAGALCLLAAFVLAGCAKKETPAADDSSAPKVAGDEVIFAAGSPQLDSLSVETAQPRTMAFCDDPHHAWIRDSWKGRDVDPRLPMTSHRGRT